MSAFVSSFTPGMSGRAVRIHTRGVSPRSSSVRKPTKMGIVPFIPNFVLIGGYGYMAYRFARGFRSTTYQQDYRIPLAMFWPFLFAVNGSFRKNFLTAIKSED